MEKFITATGKTIDLAIEAALRELKMDRDSVSVEVLENPRSGFLGIGAAPAKVKVTYEVPDEEVRPAPALSSASRSKPKKAESRMDVKPLNPINPPKPKAEPKAETARPAEKSRPVEKPRAEEKPRPEEKPQEKREKRQPKVQKTYEPAAPGSKEERIETFIKGLLEHMGSDAVPHAVKSGDDVYNVDLVGNSLGMLIGHRGETLDALQYLASLVANHVDGSYFRVTLDVGNYREKRKETLESLGKKMAARAVKTGRNSSLEPMNPYERRIIHTAVQTVEGAKSWSEGVDQGRHVVIGPEGGERPQPRRNDRRGGRNDRNGRSRGGYNDRNRRPRNDRNRPDPKPRAEGPKSDDPNTPIYGRIEKK